MSVHWHGTAHGEVVDDEGNTRIVGIPQVGLDEVVALLDPDAVANWVQQLTRDYAMREPIVCQPPNVRWALTHDAENQLEAAKRDRIVAMMGDSLIITFRDDNGVLLVIECRAVHSPMPMQGGGGVVCVVCGAAC